VQADCVMLIATSNEGTTVRDTKRVRGWQACSMCAAYHNTESLQPRALPITNEPPGTSRDVFWDCCRAAGTCIVVALHGLVAYTFFVVPGLLWSVRERGWGPAGSTRVQTLASGESWAIDGALWLLRACGVPMMALIAGWFAAKSLKSREPGAFVRERARRLGVPLLVGGAMVLPVMYLVWAVGWIAQGEAEWSHIAHVRFARHLQPQLYGLAHLWFVSYLLSYCVVLAGVWWAWARFVKRGCARWCRAGVRVRGCVVDSA
jgi:hypothetical protein